MLMAKKRPLWSLTQGHRGRYATAILAMALANFFLFCVPIISQAVIDGLLMDTNHEQRSFLEQQLQSWGRDFGKIQTLSLAAISVILLTSLGGLFHYLRGRYAAMASEGIVRRIRNTLYKHLQELPLQYHDKADTGDLLQRSSSDVETIRVFLSDQVVEIAKAILLLASVMPILIWLDEEMAALSVVLFPPILIFAYFFFGKVKALFLSADEAEGEMTTVLQENLTGIRVVRAFARQDFECQKFGDKNQRHRDRDYTLLRYLAIYWSISDFMCLGQIGIVLIAGAHFLNQGQITLGVLSAFLTYIGILIWPVRHLGRVLSEAGKALVALQRLNEVLEEKVESQLGESVNTTSKPPLIELKNVSFSYQSGGKVIDNLSFTVQPGETLAILGPTGAGKSTLIRLLMRLYDVTDGQILIDGQDIAQQSRRSIRAQMSVVLAEAFLFSKSVLENLSFGRKNAPQKDLEQCAQDACIAESIDKLKEGYQTLIGERGVTLSGGQRQRLALARALVRDAPILILDDALSAVDTKTEGLIRNALAKRKSQKTTVIISHRLSSVLHADRILVLEKGKLVQWGSHDELMQENGPYKKLWAIQNHVEHDTKNTIQFLETKKGLSHDRKESPQFQPAAS